MTELPRLELFDEENKNNEYIIFRNKFKSKKTRKTRKTSIKRQRHKKKHNTKKIKTRRKKGFFNLF